MPRPPSVTPTDGELEILQIVWRHDRPVSTRAVHDELSKIRTIDHTTVTTLMGIMEDKGLLRIVDPRRPRTFEATKSRQTTARAMVKRLANVFTEGSIAQLLQQLTGGRKFSAAEEAQIEEEFGKGQ